jgi:hypothetical protein
MLTIPWHCPVAPSGSVFTFPGQATQSYGFDVCRTLFPLR